ncbi:hypothetical protein BGZ94_003874, partial [Podila epigama]
DTTNSAGEGGERHLRQHDHDSLRQHVRRHKIASIDGTCRQDMAALPGHGHETQDDIRSFSLQPGRRTITQDGGTVGVASGPSILPPSGQNMGPFPRGLVRLPSEPSATQVHDMEATPSSSQPRRNAALVENTGQPLCLPSMESHPTVTAETEDRATGSDHHNSVLAISNMVPNGASNGNAPAHPNRKRGRPPGSRKPKQHPGQEQHVEPVSLARKRQALMAKGVSNAAAMFIAGNRDTLRTQQRYMTTQEDFLNWLKEGSVDLSIDPAVPIVNWLYQIMATQNLQWSTVLTKKTAVLALFDNAEIIKQEHCFKEFMRAGSSSVIVDTKHDDYDISRVLDRFRMEPSIMTMDMSDLARKLRWLLGVYGFMRPDDIFCTTLAMDLPLPHPKDPEVKITPLIRHSKDLSKPLLTTTINVYMNAITRCMLPAGVRPPMLRALGSTLADLAGVPVADIMVQGNWSSPKIFEKHNRLSSATTNNMSLSTLGIPLESHTDMAR